MKTNTEPLLTNGSMKPEIGITEKHLHKSITLLSAILSNEMTLYVKTRKFHWNVSKVLWSSINYFKVSTLNWKKPLI